MLIRSLAFAFAIVSEAAVLATTAAPSRVKAPIVVEDITSAPTWITLTPVESADGTALHESLKDIINENTLSKIDSRKSVPLSDLREAGLEAHFDERAVELRIHVPPSLRKANAISLSNEARVPLGPVYEPAPFSAYVNAYGTQEFLSQQGAQPFLGNFDAAINIHRWVLESNISSRASDLRRGDLRLVRDDPDHLLRYAAGDLAYPVFGYQRFVPMAGFTVARNFSLQPNRVFYPVSRNEVFLETPSKVNIWVNGRLFRYLELPAGPHRFDDLPLVSGVNRVRLEITDAFGRTRIEDIPYAFDTQLLDQGIRQFAYSVGLPSSEATHVRIYDRQNITYSAFHRVGWTRRFTSGLYLQGDRHQEIGGLEGLYSTEFGSFAFESALSRMHHDGIFGNATRVTYQYTLFDEIERRFSLGVEMLSRRFAPLQSLEPDNPSRWIVSTGYSQPLLSVYTFSISLQKAQRAAWDSSVALNRSWSNGLQAGLDLSYRHQSGKADDYGAFLNLLWTIPESRHQLALRSDTRAETTRAEWQYRSPNRVSGFNTNMATERARHTTRLLGQADYTGTRGVAAIEHEATRHDSSAMTHITSLRAGASLAFAGGHVALGRPVMDSFALVSRHEGLAHTPVEVNPDDEGFEARADGLGPALLPELISYREQAIRLGARELSLGQELGPEYRVLRPTYRSGLAVEAGTAATVFLRATVRDRQGQPLSLKAGQLMAPNSPPILVFTNRAGRFQAEGLRPGTYELQWFDESLPPRSIEIPARSAGLVDLGILEATK